MGWQVRARIGVILAVVAAPVVVCAQVSEGVDAAGKKLAGAEGLLARGQYDLARQEFDEFLKMYPQDARARQAQYERGVCEFNLNDAAGAVTDLTAAIADTAFAKRDEALSLLGTLYLQQGRLESALASLNRLVKEYPASTQIESAQVNRAQALYRLGRFEESLNAVRELLKAFPQSGYRASALYVGAIDQRNLGDEKEAERTLREVVTAYPNSPFVYDARLLIGESLVGQGRTDEAVAYYRQLETDAPESRKPAVEFGLASAFMRAGKYADAERTFDGVIQSYANSTYAVTATLQRAVAQLKAGRRDDARAAFAVAARQYPQVAPSAGYWLARADLLDGKYEEAARQLERLVSNAGSANNMPEAPDAEFDLAYCELRLGHDAVALQRLEAFRTRYPRSVHSGEALYYEASALYGLGQFAKSVEFCEAVEKLGTTTLQPEASMLHGESLLMLGEYAKADAIFAPLEQSASTDEGRLRLRFRRGQCAYFSGDYAAAEARLAEVARSAVRGDPVLGEASFLLGDAQLRQGKDAQAEATLKEYIAGAGSAKNVSVQEAMFKLATAQEHLNEDAAAAATLKTIMSAGGADDLKSSWLQRAWFEDGQLAYQRGDASEATHAMEKLLAAKPEAAIAASALYLLARIEMSGGRNDEAAAKLAELARDYPQDPLSQDAAFIRGIALKNAQHPDAAAKQFAAYLQAYPTGKYVTQARHERAVALTALHNSASSAEAVRMLEDLAKGSGRNDTVLYDLVWAYRSCGDQANAEATYRSLLKEYPNGSQSTAARVELAQMLYAKQHYAEAAGLLTTAVADARADAHLHAVAVYWSAACAAARGDDATAARLFDSFVAGNPKDPLVPEAIGDAGAAYARLQEFDEAESRLRRVIAEFPGTDAAIRAVVSIGEAQNQAGDYGAAADTFTKWLADHANSPLKSRAQFGLGWSLENRGKMAEARAQYAEVVANDNGEVGARSQFQIGETWFAEKQYETAARELLKVDILYSVPQWSARALYEAGRSFEELHEPDRAKHEFTACLQKYKDSDVAPLARKRLDSLVGAAK